MIKFAVGVLGLAAMVGCSPATVGAGSTGVFGGIGAGTIGSGSTTGGTQGSTATASAGTTASGGTPTTVAAASSGTTGSSCPGYAPPNTVAGCSCESGHTCTANNCYGSYYCELSNLKCVAEPASCMSGTGPTTTGTTASSSGAATTTTSAGTTGAPGTVGINGGSVSSLLFAAVGDTRPPSEGNSSDNQTENYPTAIITTIYQAVQAANVQFAVATGDYQFASPSTQAGPAQLALYAQARANYSGVVFPAVGNHECDGATADNCDDNGNILSSGGGTSNNYAAFKSTLLDPIQQTLPYYTININSTDGSWTSKFIFVACNFWDSTQTAWLTSQLQTSTTYTFIIVHEDDDASTLGPCQSGSPTLDSILSGGHYTLRIAGHAHEYHWNSGVKEVTVGNGGAQLASSSDQYGYAIISMVAGGNIQIAQYDYNSGTVVGTEEVTP